MFGALQDNLNTLMYVQNNVQNHLFVFTVFVSLRELTDDVQRKLAERFTTTASFLDGGSSG